MNRETAERYSSYGLGEAAKGLYEFAWNDVCDWYLELSKRRLNPGENPSAEALADQRVAKQVLAKVISQMHLMLHPLMPHLTESSGTASPVSRKPPSWPCSLGRSWMKVLWMMRWKPRLLS